MKTQTITFEHGDHEISVWLTAQMERCDYGVPRSPVWWEVVDVEIDQVEIDKKMFSEKQVIETFGAEFAKEIAQTAEDMADGNGWT